ncbi:sensor histidine kinase [Methylocapsa palsarum]|uniref:histidine kinase n=1 Tax=Methylocapsa palsarum TaxID=1612308 RepID=A0A1I3Z664_9HYPH|nr:sensor histidine kinase [Methylocapsa palsarum]SFK39161.1 Two-component sensor histidine kinase, contains HisKA and HATPase domains [Methylocapsa palsarum]
MAYLMVESDRKLKPIHLDKWKVLKLPSARRNAFGGYLFAVALAILVVLIRDFFIIPSPGIFLLMSLPAVSLAALAAGAGPAVAAAAVSAMFAFLAPPAHTVSPDSPAAAALIFAFGAAFQIEIVRRLQQTRKDLSVTLQKTEAKLTEQHLLFRDLQHRVANNLQFASSVLTLQRRRVMEDPSSAPDALDDARERLVNMAIIYRRLYAPGQMRVSLSAYLEGLCLDLIEASTSKDIACRVESTLETIDDRKLVPVSLILTEIVTNAVKHAFDGESGEIDIHLGAAGGACVLTVRDNGRGLPDNFQPSMRTGQGLLIMQALTRQLGGELEFSRAPQTTVRLSFPREDNI